MYRSVLKLSASLLAKNFTRSHLSPLSGNLKLNHKQLPFSARLFSSSEPVVINEKKDQVFFIRLNRPNKFNALTPEVYEAIIDSLNQSKEDPDVKFTVVTGNGKYFSSGNDLTNFNRVLQEHDGDMVKAGEVGCQNLDRFVSAFIDYPKILIGAVNGPAFGIMFTILGLFDVVIASDDAVFVCPFSSLGQSPEGCSTYTFPRIFGNSLASELLYLNYQMPVEEAHRLGFVSRIVKKDQMESHLNEWLLGEKGLVQTCYPNSMFNAKTKLVRNEEQRKILHKVKEVENKILMQSWLSEECMEAVVNFLNRPK